MPPIRRYFRAVVRRIRTRATDAVAWLISLVLFGVSALIAQRLGLHGRRSVTGIAGALGVGSVLVCDAIGEGWHRLRHGPRPPARHKRPPGQPADGNNS